jgi:hypothetical protein
MNCLEKIMINVEEIKVHNTQLLQATMTNKSRPESGEPELDITRQIDVCSPFNGTRCREAGGSLAGQRQM